MGGTHEAVASGGRMHQRGEKIWAETQNDDDDEIWVWAGLTPRSEIPVFVVSSLLQPDDPESNEDDFYFLWSLK